MALSKLNLNPKSDFQKKNLLKTRFESILVPGGYEETFVAASSLQALSFVAFGKENLQLDYFYGYAEVTIPESAAEDPPAPAPSSSTLLARQPQPSSPNKEEIDGQLGKVSSLLCSLGEKNRDRPYQKTPLLKALKDFEHKLEVLQKAPPANFYSALSTFGPVVGKKRAGRQIKVNSAAVQRRLGKNSRRAPLAPGKKVKKTSKKVKKTSKKAEKIRVVDIA